MSSQNNVVISGIGGYFPKSLDLDDFKDLLLENVTSLGPAKWKTGEFDICNLTNNLPDTKQNSFDTTYFGVHRNQAIYMDPMSRMFLEKTFEALIDAGVNPMDIRGKKIAVTTGSCIGEYDNLIMAPIKNGLGVTGQSRSMLPNRISYWLNVTGPSVAIDANWVNGVQVIKYGCDLIKRGDCDSAIVGASNLIGSPNISYLMKQCGFTSEDGLTKSFDDKADGYGRSDGIIILYLQREDLAKRKYASILYSDVAYMGTYAESITSCNVNGITDFLEKCYQNSGIEPNQLEYLETYGCGIKNIDEAELTAVERVICKNRKLPLPIGSVKTNVGHSEAAAALTALIKLIVAMETGILPAHLNYDTPNMNIQGLQNGRFDVVTKNRPWKGGIVALNALAMGDHYGHIILQSNPKSKISLTTDLPLLTTFSTRTEDGINKIVETVKSQSIDLEYNKLVHDVFSKNIPGHLYRGYVVKNSINDQSQVMHYEGGKARPIWFIYSGMGSQWHTMGKDLIKLPIFAESIKKCHDVLVPKGIDLLSIITEDDPKIFDNILHSFVGIAAIQIGLTDVLHAIGIIPDGIIGHSVGELGCAYADHCLTAEQMILSAYYRGKASLESELINGMMAAIGLSYSQLNCFCPETIDIACHNSSTSCTISGPAEDVDNFVKILVGKQIFAKLVNVSNIAYHSRYIKPAAPLLLSYLQKLLDAPKERSSKWISTSVPESKWGTELARTVSAEYLTNNLLSSVLFEEGLTFIPSNAIAIEIAPHGLLQAILKRELHQDIFNIALTKRNSNCLDVLFESLGKLYMKGVNFNLSKLYPSISLPVSRGTPSLCKLVHWEHSDDLSFMLDADLLKTNNEHTFTINLNSKEYETLHNYQINGKIYVPYALYFVFLLEILEKQYTKGRIIFEDIIFNNSVELKLEEPKTIIIMIQQGTKHFEVMCQNSVVISGQILILENEKNISIVPRKQGKTSFMTNTNDFYLDLLNRGYDYHANYKCVSSFNSTEKGFVGTINWHNNWEAILASMLQLHTFHFGYVDQNILLPKYIQKIDVSLEYLTELDHEQVTVSYNNYCNILESDNGIHIFGLEYEAFKMPDKSMIVQKMKFIKHFDENFSDIQHGINLCMKIITDNIKSTNNLQILEIRKNYERSYVEYIEKYLKQHNIKVNIDLIDSSNYNTDLKTSLTIIRDKFYKNLEDIYRKGSHDYILLCNLKKEQVSIPKKYTVVAKFKVKGNTYYLLKLINKFRKTITEIVNTNCKTWISDLINKINKIEKTYVANRSVYIIQTSSKESIEKLTNYIMDDNIPNQLIIRFLFVMDKYLPEQPADNLYFKTAIEKDLKIQVLKNNSWGSYVNFYDNIKLSDNVTDKSETFLNTFNTLSKFCDLKYLALHNKNLSLTKERNTNINIGYASFSGTTTANSNIIGLAQINMELNKVKPDKSFVWTIPYNWSLSDGVTLPFAYTMAYYLLFEIGRIEKNDSILVHAGCTEIGMAVLHIAINHNCTVYTTVANEMQKVALKKFLCQEKDDNILSSENCNFELDLLNLTCGKGVQMVLNCFTGNYIDASKRCLSLFGRFIQLGTTDAEQHHTTGMNVFLKTVAFYGVTVEKLFNETEQVKQKLHRLVMEGIENGLIKATGKKLFHDFNIDSISKYLENQERGSTAVIDLSKTDLIRNFNNNNNINELLQESKVYLIVGNLQIEWLHLIKILIRKGAQKIIISVSKDVNYQIKHHLQKLEQFYKTNIIIVKKNLNKADDLQQLIKQISLFSKISDVFVFPDEKNTIEFENKQFNDIDIALYSAESRARIIYFLGQFMDKIFVRENGLPVYNIAWENEYKLADILQNFDVLLNDKDVVKILVKNEIPVKEISKSMDNSIYLPDTLKTLHQIGISPKKKSILLEMTTNFTKKFQDTPPLFIIPGLTGPYCPYFHQFINNLIYPVYCINVSGIDLYNINPAQIAKEICEIYKCQVYNLIGVGWGGVLAIEIAKMLENMNEKVCLHLIDGAPKTIQLFANSFTKSGKFDDGYLKQVIKLQDIHRSLYEVLEENVSLYSQNDLKNMMEALNILRNQIEYVNNYRALTNKIKGHTILLRTDSATNSDTSGIAEHCADVKFKTVSGNYLSMLQDKKVFEFINENFQF